MANFSAALFEAAQQDLFYARQSISAAQWAEAQMYARRAAKTLGKMAKEKEAESAAMRAEKGGAA